MDFSISDHLQRCWHYSATTQWDEIFSEGSVECLLFFENIVLFYMDFKMLLSMDFILLCLDLNILLLIRKLFLGWISNHMSLNSFCSRLYGMLFYLMKTINFSIQELKFCKITFDSWLTNLTIKLGLHIKFIYSEKATKFEKKNILINLTFTEKHKEKEIFSKFCDFLRISELYCEM